MIKLPNRESRVNPKTRRWGRRRCQILLLPSLASLGKRFIFKGSEVLVGADLTRWTLLVAEKPPPITVCPLRGRVKPLLGVFSSSQSSVDFKSFASGSALGSLL